MRWLIATPERRAAATLLGLCVLVYLPFAGSYGLWDPWETHYGEVARQMVARGDVISTWWPGSPDERPQFWSKPVGAIWLMALSLRLGGLEGAGARADELAASWRAEWALRVPFALLGIVGVWAVFVLVSRLRGRRAGFLSGLVLATSSQWLLVARQAVTDMPFVVPMTAALALAGLALLSPEPEPEPDAMRPRGRYRILRARAFWLFAISFSLASLPQLALISLQLHANVTVSGRLIRLPGFVPMLPYFAGFAIALRYCARARNKRQLYLFSAYLCCALAALAKGPAGLALPALVLILFLVCDGRWREIITRLELPRGLLIFAVVAFPWYHAMLIRHGMGFWTELIGDNYVNRAAGRHGDRGVFDYYLEWIGFGMFPWSGLVALGVLAALRRAGALARFALVWFLVDFVTVALVNTKFHHYILPALPALAILTGLFLDELLAGRAPSLALALVGAPITWLCARDLSAVPARLLWLFNYDYVVAPVVGRPWPAAAQYGTRYEYQIVIAAFGALAGLATLLCAPRRTRRAAVALLGAVALGWSLFLVDRFLVELSPHWSQKQVIAAYYAQRHGDGEPLITWELKWRGENFYTRNQIYSSPDSNDRTVILPEHATEHLRQYLSTHAHRRVFFLVERERFEGLRAALPEAMRADLRITDQSNNKLFLAVAENP